MAMTRKTLNERLDRLNCSTLPPFKTDQFKNIVHGSVFTIHRLEPIAPFYCEGQAEDGDEEDGCSESPKYRVMSEHDTLAAIYCTSCLLQAIGSGVEFIGDGAARWEA